MSRPIAQAALLASAFLAWPMMSGAAESLAPLTGGGSSFVDFAMGKWSAEYAAKTGSKVNYQASGSGAGIGNFSKGLLDFGATDGPMTDKQLADANGPVLHVPVVMGAVAVAYNVPELKGKLTLTGPVLADIYLGKITKWNDKAIVGLNEGAKLPEADIVVVRRSDGSGTTFIFTDYLSKITLEFEKTVGRGTSPKWPAGSIGAKGNQGVAAQVKQTANAIGYVELIYALTTNTPVASIKNKDGEVVTPSVESTTAAAADLKDFPDDLRMSITDAPGKTAYPISGIVWVLARPKSDKPERDKAVKAFLEFVLSDPMQEAAVGLKYSKLPKTLLDKARAKVGAIQ